MRRVWVLLRPRGTSPADDPRLREIHGHEEIVHPEYDAERDAFVARVRFETTRDRLTRRLGFVVIDEVDVEEAEPVVAEVPLPCPVPEVVETGPSSRGEEWAMSRARRMGKPIVPLDGSAVLRRNRGLVRGDVLGIATQAAERMAEEEIVRLGAGIGIVLTVTGWGEMEATSLETLAAYARALGAQLSLVRNDEVATKGWATRIRREFPGVKVATSPNDGFAAACRMGAKALDDQRVRHILFTQADARWPMLAAVRAAALSEVLSAEPVGFGRPALIGPSGGAVVNLAGGDLVEIGAQGANRARVELFPADWIAGYWLLVAADVYRDVGGWDDGFFLYYEDPDLSLRCAMVGARSFVWPALGVEHERATTCRARFSQEMREAIRAESRARFIARWSGVTP